MPFDNLTERFCTSKIQLMIDNVVETVQEYRTMQY